MAQLKSKVGSFTPDNLVSGIDVPVQVKAVTLKAGQGVLKRGTVLGIITTGGLAVTVNSANTDGSQTADSILLQDVDTTAENVVTEAYISGQFNRQALIFGGTDTAAKYETKLRELGIFLKDNIAY